MSWPMAKTVTKARAANCSMTPISGGFTSEGDAMADPAQSTMDAAVPADAGAQVEARDEAGMRSRGFVGVVLLLVLVAMWLAGWRSGTDAQQMFSLTIWGVMLGGIIALGGIGLTLCYGVLKFPNFAHGELVTLGAYAAYSIVLVVPNSLPIWRFSFGW